MLCLAVALSLPLAPSALGDVPSRVVVYSDGRIEAAPASAAKGASTDVQQRVARGTGGIEYLLSYDDVTQNTNAGFDDPTQGAARRAVLEQVLLDLAEVLDHTATVAVRVQLSGTTGTLHSYGGSYYNSRDGAEDSDSHKVIVYNYDQYPTYPEMLIGVNFGYNYYLGNGAVPANQHDLYSKIMSSAVRALGVLSMCKADGASEDINGYYLRTRWDSFLEVGNGSRMFDADYGDFNGTATWLTGGAGGVWFAGTWARFRYGGRVPVFAPNPFQLDLSLTSWDANVYDSAAVLTIRPASSTGINHRTLRAWELGALQDLGYIVRYQAADPAWLMVE